MFPGAEQQLYSHITEQTQKHLDSYAREGLRTLCIAKKVKTTTLKNNLISVFVSVGHAAIIYIYIFNGC